MKCFIYIFFKSIHKLVSIGEQRQYKIKIKKYFQRSQFSERGRFEVKLMEKKMEGKLSETKMG